MIKNTRVNRYLTSAIAGLILSAVVILIEVSVKYFCEMNGIYHESTFTLPFLRGESIFSNIGLVSLFVLYKRGSIILLACVFYAWIERAGSDSTYLFRLVLLFALVFIATYLIPVYLMNTRMDLKVSILATLLIALIGPLISMLIIKSGRSFEVMDERRETEN